jgi:hypothetical protein
MAGTHQAHGFSAQLEQLGLLGLWDRPLTLLQLTRNVGHASGGHEHQPQAHLGHSAAVDPWHIAHRHPMPSSGWKVNRIHTDADFLNQAQSDSLMTLSRRLSPR